MHKLTRIVVVAFLLFQAGYQSAYAQTTSISGIVNAYSAVTSLKIAVSTNPDSVIVTTPGLFSEGDIVMLYQPKGFIVDPNTGVRTGFVSNVGQYAILIVDQIIGNTIVFNASTGFISTAAGVVSQLIKVADYRDATVDGTLTAPPWNGSTGGVVALYVRGKLTLNAAIDVSGLGFRGADPSGDIYGNICYTDAGTDFKERNYTNTAVDSAGLKGEGAAKSTYIYTRGLGRVINGGGGGNAKYSGGGGGSNYKPGGKGGGQTNSCGAIETETSGEEGDAFSSGLPVLYTNTGQYRNRIFFGGGGGTGTQDPGSGFTSSAGGNGGGIVVIIADTIVSDGSSGILANGEDVTTIATGAGGGGGGGGCIALDANGFSGNIPLSAVGGKGGSTGHATFYTGPGGGGGGGVYWVSVNQSLDADNTTLPLGGTNGANPGLNGTRATVLEGLQAPLNGFLFNTLPLDDTVCSDVVPPPIDASKPKGGLGPGSYTYLWEASTDEVIWNPAPGVNNQEDYTFTAPLAVTTHYRRIVTSGTISDGDNLWVTYTVLPAITGNTIAAPDTVCLGGDPLPFYTTGTLGGANVGTDEVYNWEVNIEGAGWNSAGGAAESFGPINLNAAGTWQYRRRVTSHVCISVSNTVDVEVLPLIENNTITSRDTICNGQVPDLLDGGALVGGDPGIVSWKWEVSDNGTSGFTQTGGSTEDLNVGAALTSDKYYRRTVYSGEGDACISVSPVFKIEVLPLIDNNIIETAEDTICRGSILPLDPVHSALSPTGGDESYTFRWETNKDLAGWTTDSIYDSDTPFNTIFTGTSTQVRRTLYSGADDVCQNTSNTLTIITIPVITNNTRISDDTAACQGVTINPILFNQPGGGKESSYAYQWQQKVGAGNWTDIGTGANAKNYTPPPLDATTEYRRIVHSRHSRAICSDTSINTVIVNITPRIENNTINSDNKEFICNALPLDLLGEAPTGGTGTYNRQWQEKIGAGNFTNIGGETGDNYSDPGFTETKTFRRLLSSGVCSDTSNEALITVVQQPRASFRRTSAAEFCLGNTVSYEVTIDGGADPNAGNYTLVYGWTTDDSQEDSLEIAVLASSPFIIHPEPTTDVETEYTYVLLSIVDDVGCVSRAHSNSDNTVKVFKGPEAGILAPSASPESVCGTTVALSADPLKQGGDGGWFIEGYSDTQALTIFDNDTSSLNVSASIVFGDTEESKTLNYGWRRVAWNTPLQCGDTAFVTITHYKDPVGAYTLTSDTVVVFADEVSLRAELPSAGAGYWSAKDSIQRVNPSDALSTRATGLILNQDNEFFWTVYNGITIEGDSVCGPYKAPVIVKVEDLSFFDAFSPGVTEGFNDGFAVMGLEYAHTVYCYIYNSWGVIVRTIIQDPDYPDGVRMDLDQLGTIERPAPSGIGAGMVTYQVLWDGRSDPEIDPESGQFVNEGEILEDGIYYFKLISSRYPGEAQIEPYNGRIILKSRN